MSATQLEIERKASMSATQLEIEKSQKKIANCPKCHDFKLFKNNEGKVLDCREC